MESFQREGRDQPNRTLQEIRNIIFAYETKPDRREGHIVCRYVAEIEPQVFDRIAQETGLSTAELWRHIEHEEQSARGQYEPLPSDKPDRADRRERTLRHTENTDQENPVG